ncbi:hypothetical protein HHX47_DHR2000568 [Lentinula edodes]|nr:hypothetical protein HHX47_DHR2000568 [Lentinula edodes]
MLFNNNARPIASSSSSSRPSTGPAPSTSNSPPSIGPLPPDPTSSVDPSSPPQYSIYSESSDESTPSAAVTPAPGPDRLNYDDAKSLVDSNSSGSVFVASEGEEDDIDDEEKLVMPKARSSPVKKRVPSIAMSLDGNNSDEDGDTPNANRAGPSSGTQVNAKAALMAAVAEHRLTDHARTGVDADDSVVDFGTAINDCDNLSALFGSDSRSEPLAKKKSKGNKHTKSKSKSNKSKLGIEEPELMTRLQVKGAEGTQQKAGPQTY